MKQISTLIVLIAFATVLKAQENIISINSGYAFLKGQEVRSDFTGWRISGVYEYNPFGGPVSHGISFGYAGVSGISKNPGLDLNQTIEIGTWPIFYQPKFIFGNDKIHGFVKGAIGWQFSSIKGSNLKTSDSGIYGGGGAGLMFNINEIFFINAEYELAWVSNYYYRDGWLNSAMGGIGFRF
jgi:hypothetical protein